MYSPDGADWSGTTGDTLGTLQWKYYFDLLYMITYYSANGSGADTVAFSGSHMVHGGLPVGFNDTAYTITIGPLEASEIGRTICLDSSFFPPAGTWKWTAGPGSHLYPTWDGPHCYLVDGLDMNMTFKYLSAMPSDTAPQPMREVYVVMLDDDAGQDDTLAEGYTDENGFIDFPAVSNYDSSGSGGQDLYFEVYAANEAARMTINPSWFTTVWTTDTTNNMPSGTHNWTATAPIEQSKPFHVADRVLDAYRKWDDLSPNDPVSDSLEVVLKPYTIGSRYDPDDNYLFINDSAIDSLQAPDTWDRDIVYHEYGHYIEWDLDFFDVVDTVSHDMDDTISVELAAREGFSHWWTCVANGGYIWRDFFNDFQDSVWFNIENGLLGDADQLIYGVNAMGVKNEGAVAGILWDIYDSNDDDWSDSTDFFDPYDTTDSPDDGFGDELSDGPDYILAALLDGSRMIGGHHPDDILEFWEAWFTYPEFGYDREMTNIFFEHGDSTRPCCVGIRGNVDGDPADEIDIVDLLYLVDYMFTGGPEPSCVEEANISLEYPGIDISDLVYLVDYMFCGGAEPPSCYDKKNGE